MTNITPIIEAVIALVGVVITAVVIPYIRSRTTAQQRAEINAWVRVAVSAAEQMAEFQGSKQGPAKKAFVLKWLEERGITVDAAKLDAMIEAAVYELNSGVLLAD